ncbi:MAG: Osmosensitive K+ channel histidine kinase KdpD [Nitrospira sp.]|jgi:two-component system sensor histidine kinase KdpD|nr:MAG: Osmosensitive K+ channel histidine kinase KdpD [Nitrospira sp.]
MDTQRPDPDALLRRVQADEADQARGKLKVFFGATAGVGKTYAMLQAAHEQLRDGIDVMIGWVETHGRAETEALVHGLPAVAPREVAYGGSKLRDFDLDAALSRRPQLLLMDELAHTNAPGSRHPKRWQDVRELLQAGINVFTTVNVQHLEALNDAVAQITGIRVSETVPDSILEQADDVELVDLPPDDLLQRLKDGKVYMPEQVQHALKHFFRKGNLIALREMALRRTAERVDQQMEVYRRDHAVVATWPAAETILVCVNLKSRGPMLVRAARKMAAGLHARWIAVYVQTSKHLRLPDLDRSQGVDTLRLAERMGAETTTLTGDDVSAQLLAYARSRNVTKIILGKPLRSRWKEWLFGSVVDDLIRGSGDIDIYVMSGEAGAGKPLVAGLLQRTSERRNYGYALGVVLACTALSWGMSPYFGQANLIMVYLFGVAVIATRWGRGPSALASLMSVAAFDFFFIPPYYSFAVSDVQYLLTFAVMLVVALLITRLASAKSRQAEAALIREQRTAALYAMSRELITQRGVDMLASVASRHIHDEFRCQVAVFLPDRDGRVHLHRGEALHFDLDPKESGISQWVFDHKEPAGHGTDTLSGSHSLYLPLLGAHGAVGVLAVRSARPAELLDPEQLHLLETFANQMASALERARLAEETQEAHVQAETERMRNAVLSSVSHDLRTPLATIVGASSALLSTARPLSSDSQQELVRSISDEAGRLDRLLKNLLDMTRLEAGAMQLRKEWHALDEVVGTALARVKSRIATHPVSTTFPDDLPLVLVDGVLIEQVLINLLENAVKYSPPASPIKVTALVKDGMVVTEVADRGPGIPQGEERRIFEKFYRLHPDREGGVGLGLTICQGIVESHGGRIWVDARHGGGSNFRFTLPIAPNRPTVEPEINEHDRAVT